MIFLPLQSAHKLVHTHTWWKCKHGRRVWDSARATAQKHAKIHATNAENLKNMQNASGFTTKSKDRVGWFPETQHLLF